MWFEVFDTVHVFTFRLLIMPSANWRLFLPDIFSNDQAIKGDTDKSWTSFLFGKNNIGVSTLDFHLKCLLAKEKNHQFAF